MPNATTRELRLVSWNVNGLRATLKKDPSFPQIFAQFDADVFAIQETKLQDDQRAKLKDIQFEGYHQTWNYADRKGYSGTAVWSREEPLQVIRQIGRRRGPRLRARVSLLLVRGRLHP